MVIILDARVARSIPAGVDGFFQSVKILSMTCFGREVKPWVPCRRFTARKRTYPRFIYATAHSPTLPLLHLRHSSFSNPSFASPTSQDIYLRHLASRPCYFVPSQPRNLFSKKRPTKMFQEHFYFLSTYI